MEPSPSRSALRAAALIGLAVAAVLVAGVVYLRPSFRAPAAAATPPPPRPALGSAFFADADHGVVAVIPAGGSNSIATLFVTRDGGRTWSRELGRPASTILSGPLSGSRFLVVASTQPGPGSGVRVSGDGGRTWRTLPAPPGILQPYIVYGVGGSPMLLSATDGWWMTRPAPGDPYTIELWRTRDGSTWTRLPAAGIPGDSQPEQLWFADDAHGLLLVTDPDGGISVLATDDGGAGWRKTAWFGPPFLGAWTLTAALVPHDRRLVLCLYTLPNAPRSGAVPGPFTQNVGIYLATSTDGGATWGPLVAGPELSSGGIPQFDDRGRMLLLSDRRLWVSDASGSSWQSRPVGLPAAVRVLGLLPAGGGALYAIGVSSAPVRGAPAARFPPTVLLKSRDGGAHWVQVALPTPAG
jgi:hypothetical protein